MTSATSENATLTTFTCIHCGARQVEEITEAHEDIDCLMCSNCYGVTDLAEMDKGEMVSFWRAIKAVMGGK